MCSTILLLTFLTSLATAALLPTDSSAIKAGLATRNLQNLIGYGEYTAERDQPHVEESNSSPTKRAEITTRQLKLFDTVSGQEIPDDVMDPYGSGILTEGLGTRIKRSVSKLSKTVLERAKSTTESKIEKHARDTGREAGSKDTYSATSEAVTPNSRIYWRTGKGACPSGRGKGETQSNEGSAHGEANGVQGSGHVANVADASYNGFAFGQAIKFPHR